MPATDPATDYVIRPMRPDDVLEVERLTADGFYDVDVRTHRVDWPEPTRRTAAGAQAWRERARHMVGTDPGGCFVAEDSSGVIGAVIALRRELTWILSSYAVRPGLQGRGVGKQLMLASLEHGRGCLRGLISASHDQGAVRRYHAAGFTLHPMMFLRGPVPREVLPVVDRVREGSAGDIDLMDSVDRRTRDSAHGVDHEFLVRHHRLVVVDRSTGQGYAYVEAGGGAHLLAATNRRTATDLLGVPGRLLPRRRGRDQAPHRRERLGRRRRDGRPDGAAHLRLPRHPGHAAAGALPPERPLPLSHRRSDARRCEKIDP